MALGLIKKVFSKKSNNKIERDQILGGLCFFSHNQKYEIIAKEGEIYLFYIGKLLFQKSIFRPFVSAVNNNGLIACFNISAPDSQILGGELLFFDNQGKQLFSKTLHSNILDILFFKGQELLLFSTASSEEEDAVSIFIIDTKSFQILAHLPRRFDIMKIYNVETQEKIVYAKCYYGYDLVFDFNGNQLNIEEYENEILSSNLTKEKLNIFLSRTDEENYKSELYVKTLIDYLNEGEEYMNPSKDRLLRKIGEYYLANGDIERTIKYWAEALEINPKVGLATKLKKLNES